MEREQYAVMARREDDHWWYAGMRRVALRVLDRALAGRSGLLVLDAGCGTGGTTARLRRYGRVVGVDLAWDALQPARGRGLDGRLARGDIQRLPFRDATFDAATSFEVVYHLGVANDAAALAEAEFGVRRLEVDRPGVVDVGADALLGQTATQRLAVSEAGGADHEQVKHAVLGRKNHAGRKIAEPEAIPAGQVTPRRIPGVQVAQFDRQTRRLELVQT